jgi:hypothetical protein
MKDWIDKTVAFFAFWLLAIILVTAEIIIKTFGWLNNTLKGEPKRK